MRILQDPTSSTRLAVNVGREKAGSLNVDATNDRRIISALAKLLREELQEARFSVANLVRTEAGFHPGEAGGSTTTTFKQESQNEVDAHDLKALHDAGGWKSELFQYELWVETLPAGAESASRQTQFENLLDDLGVLSDGHVAHALGSLIVGPNLSDIHRDSPVRDIGIAKVADLWNYLVIDACLDTSRRTASKVVRWCRGGKLLFETHVLLGQLRADKPFVLRNGLAIERLPLSSEHFRHWLPTRASLEPSDYLDRTLLRIPCTIAPALSKPSKITHPPNGVPTVSWKTHSDLQSKWPLPLGGIHELTCALSLVCDVAVETPMVWLHYGEHAHFWHRFRQSWSGTGEPIPRTESESSLTPDNLKEALNVQPSLCEAPTDIRTAMRYWLKSKARRTDVRDGLVFLRTALEALLLDDGHRSELAFRLAIHGAWYTGLNRKERHDRYEVLRDVYKEASGVVHSGRATEGSSDLLKKGQDICRDALLKRLSSAKKPVWADIIFGR